MNDEYIFTSLTRISDLQQRSFEVAPLPREQWELGDYIATEITYTGSGVRIELCNGRMMDPLEGEKLIGAFGNRFATLELTGSWETIEADGKIHLLTAAGLMGKMSSRSVFAPIPIETWYLGHILINGEKKRMQDQLKTVPSAYFDTPVVLLVGTSMSAGKTTTGRIVTRLLKGHGLKVLGVKLTGAGRFRDILALKDAGADIILDFVDAGLPSSICPEQDYLLALDHLLSRMAQAEADVAVVEIGASPMEPYNGAIAIRRIWDNIKCKILCASDPYAVYGVMHGFNFIPDLVGGPAINTIAATDLVKKLCGVRAFNFLLPENLPVLDAVLKEKLSI